MSRTRREYNDPDSKFYQRIVFRQLNLSFWDKLLFDHYLELLRENEQYAQWLKHAVLCMGRCPSCKDHKRDQQVRTRKRKEMKFI